VNGRERVEALVAGSRRIADGNGELGRRTRRLIQESTGLSAENVDWALSEALETSPAPAELSSLVASVAPARTASVILPANVFVAAHRAIALALAASPVVRVRPSRREPHFARLLHEAAPGLFELVDELAPENGDHVFAYGGDATLASLRAQLPHGVTLHAHGPGFGVALLDGSQATPDSARSLALDVCAFDQRGCLSPRAAFVLGDASGARRFAELVARALAERAERVPLGRLDDGERADMARFRDVAAYTGALLPAGPGWVAATDGPAALLAPIGRNLAISSASSVESTFAALDRTLVTAVGVAGSPELAALVAESVPGARVSALGRMQRPAFDGPVDRRALAHGSNTRG
jgi:hypothetical protein